MPSQPGDRSERRRGVEDGRLERDSVDRRGGDITVGFACLANLRRPLWRGDRSALDETEDLRAQPSNLTKHRLGLDGRAGGILGRGFANEAARRPAEIHADEIAAGFRHVARLVAGADISRCKKACAMRRGDQLDLASPTKPIARHARPRFGIEQDDARKIDDPVKAPGGDLLDERLHVGARVEGRGAKQHRNIHPPKDLATGEFGHEGIAFVDRQHADRRRRPHYPDAAGVERQDEISSPAPPSAPPARRRSRRRCRSGRRRRSVAVPCRRPPRLWRRRERSHASLQLCSSVGIAPEIGPSRPRLEDARRVVAERQTVSRPVCQAPVSMSIRLERNSGSSTMTWPWTTRIPQSRSDFRNGSRIHNSARVGWRSSG